MENEMVNEKTRFEKRPGQIFFPCLELLLMAADLLLFFSKLFVLHWCQFCISAFALSPALWSQLVIEVPLAIFF